MYQVFARKWRPQRFDAIVGQDPTTRTLQNAIESGHIHHAYLFSGPRGIGKTSIARIFSKALNCDKGPSREPCNECDSCRAITSGSSVDVIEIDGASNNSVDDVRTLREHVLVAPMNSRFKIYIIDEVHMLSVAAFNALLKTLEEPPGHIKFMFATTEPHKIPGTIISRCQRFDLRRISTEDIVKRLREISDTESIDVDDSALHVIARVSEGAMRDGESIFDQMVSFCGKKITSQDVVSVLGLVSEDVFWELDEAIARCDVEKGFEIARSVVEGGKHTTRFIEDMISHYRDLLVAKSSKDPAELLDMGQEEIDKHVKYAGKLRREQLLYVMDVLADALDKMRFAVSQRVSLEVAMVKVIRSSARVFIDDILEKIGRSDIDAGKIIAESGGRKGGAEEETTIVSRPAASVREPADAPRKKTSEAENSSKAPLESLSASDKVELESLWGRILGGVKSPRLKEQLSFGKLIEVDNRRNVVKIGFLPEDSFHLDTINTHKGMGTLKNTLSEHLGREVDVVVERIDGAATPERKQEPSLVDNEIVRKAQQIFGGKFLGRRR